MEQLKKVLFILQLFWIIFDIKTQIILLYFQWRYAIRIYKILNPIKESDLLMNEFDDEESG